MTDIENRIEELEKTVIEMYLEKELLKITMKNMLESQAVIAVGLETLIRKAKPVAKLCQPWWLRGEMD